MHDKVILMLDCTECCACQKRPDLMWVWDGVEKVTIVQNAAAAAETFTRSAVAHLKAGGWRMIDDALYCPDCASKKKPTEVF
jgi:hypothetical protein